MAVKARDGKINVADLQGGTFTITNGGIFGSMMSTPILNPPQSAILGMHAIQKRPVVRDDQVVIRSMMYLALTYDHRLIDGREAVRILRKNGFKAPIIMLTGHDTDSDTILGLESGANDYVTKPFRFAVLLARIRAQLRQHEASEDAVFTIGPYTFRPSSKLLLNPKGNKVRLTEKETSILRYLYRAGQRPVSRETLLQEVWGYNSGVTTHTLETHIYRLRQKIEKDAAAPAILVTEAGGYKLVP